MKKLVFLTLVLCSTCPGYTTASDLPCSATYGDEGYICVCNSNYCDTVETPNKLDQGYFYQYKTSESTPGFTRSIGSFDQSVPNDGKGFTFTINASATYQQIVGFGGAITDSAGIVIQSLPKEAQKKLIESYFGPTGIEYTVLRLPIGGTDFSPRVYTLDDKAGDTNLTHFSLTKEDTKIKIPVIKQAMAASKRYIKLLACSWVPPAWMKIGNVLTAQYIKNKFLHSWAQYYVRFLEEYQKRGVKVWALTGGNEPFILFKWNGQLNQNFSLMTAPVQRDWLKNHLKPLLMSSNFSDVKFITLDDQRTFAPYWMKRFAIDSEAFAAVDGIGLHTYDDSLVPPSWLDDIHKAYPDKLIMYTETSINNLWPPVVLGSWERADRYLTSLFENLNHWAVTFIDWNIALDTDGGPTITNQLDAPIIVNQYSKEFYKQPMFYAMGHFSKFVPPGAIRVNVTSKLHVSSPRQDEALGYSSSDWKPSTRKVQGRLKDQDTVLNVAFTNPDGSCTVILYNTYYEDVSVTINDPRVGSVHSSLESLSVNTYVYWP